MLKYRLILGPIMIGALLGVLWLDQWAADQRHARAGLAILLLLMLPGIRFAACELAIMLRAKGVATGFRVLFLAGTAGCVGVYAAVQDTRAGLLLEQASAMPLVSLGIGAMLLGVLAQCRGQNTEGTIAAGAAAAFAFVYLGLMPGTLLAIRAEHSAWVLAAALLVTKSCDIGAYFTGRAIGKHKLIPWLSPGKTWEGLAGGVALAAIVALLTLTPDGMAGLHWAYALLVGAILAVVGQGGDLLASMLKRDAQVKDSGKSIPGFGGVLDVIDLPLLAGPIAYWLLAIAG